jgi:4-amino-4-deoxy-L-arabinose transferase-like glycosyltransferase
MKISYTSFIVIYLTFLTILSFFTFPSYDIIHFYYPWSLNLQLSYYDGPPLIAYALFILTHIFGHTLFAINFLAVLILTLTTYVIFQLGGLIVDKKLGAIAALMWLTYPFSTTKFIYYTLNYDGLENLFSLATIYFAILNIKTNQKKYLFLLGITAGLALLSKYTAIITILGIIIYYVWNNKKVFLQYPVYLSILICVIIFLPVLIWNYQHHWVSFIYQLTAHTWGSTHIHQDKTGIKGLLFYICSDILGVMHILLLVIIYAMGKKYLSRINTHYNNLSINFLWIMVATYFVFWLLISCHSHVAPNYLLPMDSILILLAAFYMYQLCQFKLIKVLLCLFLISSIIILIYRTFFLQPGAGDMIQFNDLKTILWH